MFFFPFYFIIILTLIYQDTSNSQLYLLILNALFFLLFTFESVESKVPILETLRMEDTGWFYAPRSFRDTGYLGKKLTGYRIFGGGGWNAWDGIWNI